MSDNSRIEWTDATWNPTRGCTKVSPGCDHCYAETLVNGRLAHKHPGGFGNVMLLPERLDQPLRWRRPRRVFVNSLSDLFHDDVPDDYIAQVWVRMAMARQHTFQILTKRHGRMRSLLSSEQFQELAGAAAFDLIQQEERPVGWEWPVPDVWLGVSVENQQWADIRVPALLDTPAAVRFLSCEPLLGSVNLDPWRNPGDRPDPCTPADTRINWVIVGGESGKGARPMHPDWARSLRDQSVAAGVPFFFKQWGEYGPLAPGGDGMALDYSRAVSVADDGTVYGPGDLAYPDGPRYGEAIRANHGRAHLMVMHRVGKRVAGRELDGRTWDEMPDGDRTGAGMPLTEAAP